MKTSGSSHPRRVALDTSAYSRLQRGHDGTSELVADAEDVLIPTIVLGELAAAFRGGRLHAANARMLSEFLEQPYVSVLPVTADVARVYGRLFQELKAAGKPMSTNDLWIAATALEAGAHLVTFDGDFDAIPVLDRTVFLPE